MTLPITGAISANDINVELKNAGTSQISLNDTNPRKLADKTTAQSQIAFSDFWGKANAFELAASSNLQELNLRSYAISNGWDQSSKLNFTVNPGVYIWSDNTGIPALTIDGSWPNGVEIINNGYIMGKGGKGGDATYSSAVASQVATNGLVGGPAISIWVNCKITNNSYIGGGGGGGACGMAIGSWSGGGGGGAGGGTGGGYFGFMSGNGPGGAGGAPGQAGSAGAANGNGYGGGGGRIMPGTGGAGVSTPSLPGTYFKSGTGYGGGSGGGGGGASGGGESYAYGGAGGSGGASGGNGSENPASSAAAGGGGGGWGASGGSAAASGGIGVSIASPGGGGKAITLNGYSCTRSGTGTTYGAVS